MVRKVNKGVSMVEILIAMAVFTVMLVPIISALISGMKMSTTAKETQYRNDYVQNLMESVKSASTDELKNTTYFENMGAENVVSTVLSDGYEITGSTYFGTNHAKYSYKVKISDADYAAGLMDPSNQNPGHVEDLNQIEDAMISSVSLANYDTLAYEALLAAKVSEQRKILGTTGAIDKTVFSHDKGKRIVNIAVDDVKAADGSDAYDVVCTLTYSDQGSLGAAIGEIEYVPYRRQFKTLPNIYLMYNVCVYNGSYTDDYITFDLSRMTNPEDVNVFVIATSQRYSEDIVGTGAAGTTEAGTGWKPGNDDILYRDPDDTPGHTPLPRNQTVSMAASITTDLAKLKQLYVYHNMVDSEDTAAVPGMRDSSDLKLKWKSLPAGALGISCKELIPENVKKLEEAQNVTRNLYKVKIWMQKGDSVDDSKDPVLQGTKGGGEID